TSTLPGGASYEPVGRAVVVVAAVAEVHPRDIHTGIDEFTNLLRRGSCWSQGAYDLRASAHTHTLAVDSHPSCTDPEKSVLATHVAVVAPHEDELANHVSVLACHGDSRRVRPDHAPIR